MIQPTSVTASMMIRRSPAEVFAAFADPAITTRFWFTRASGPLEPDARVRWDWEMYGVGADVRVLAFDPGARILIEWDGAEGRTRVEWTFAPRGHGQTIVTVAESGFTGDAVAAALDSTQGFNLVLAAAKAWLEHGIVLELVGDKAPDHHVEDWRGRAEMT